MLKKSTGATRRPLIRKQNKKPSVKWAMSRYHVTLLGHAIRSRFYVTLLCHAIMSRYDITLLCHAIMSRYYVTLF